MKNGNPPPVDTIELLLRDIARRLRHAPLAVLTLVVIAAGCGNQTPTPPASTVSGPAPTTPPMPGTPPLAQPYCFSDAQCGGDLPRCNGAGACVACVSASDCADANLACDSGRCGACKAHADCASGLCEAKGTCAPLSAVVYVDHDHPCRNEAHASTATDPYCEIAPALPATGEVVVQVAPSATPYASVLVEALQPLHVSLMGTSADQVSIVAGATAAAVQVDGTHGELATVLVHRMTLLGSPGAFGLSCTAKSSHGQLTIDDVVVRNGGSYGISTVYCDVALSNSSVHDNALIGVALLGATATLSNDFFYANGYGGLSLSAMTGTFEHLTLVGNRGTQAAGVLCTGPNLIADSIVVDNVSENEDGENAQIDARCLLANTATGTGASRGLACAPVFVSATDPVLDLSNPVVMAENACAAGLGSDGSP